MAHSLSRLFCLFVFFQKTHSELEEDVADDTLDHDDEPLPSTSRGRSEADIALDRFMVFRYDSALDLVFKEEFTEQSEDEEEETTQPQQQQQQQQQQQPAAVSEPRRKRPRYGSCELPFPESEEQEREEPEEEVELQINSRRRSPVHQQQHLSSFPSTTQPSRRKRDLPTRMITNWCHVLAEDNDLDLAFLCCVFFFFPWCSQNSLLLSLQVSFRGPDHLHVGHKAPNDSGEGVKGRVLHLEGLALLLNDLGDGGVVAVRHGREEVVLDLEVESTCVQGRNSALVVGRVLGLSDGPVRI